MQRTVILVFVSIGLIAAGFLGWRYVGIDANSAWADPNDAVLVARGAEVYRDQCAACHGVRLEGQPNWRRRLPEVSRDRIRWLAGSKPCRRRSSSWPYTMRHDAW